MSEQINRTNYSIMLFVHTVFAVDANKPDDIKRYNGIRAT